MKFQDQKTARDALGEVLAALLDREWLCQFALNEFFGPGSYLSCFTEDEVNRLSSYVTSKVRRLRVHEDALSASHEKSDPDRIVYVFDGIGDCFSEHDFEYFWSALNGLERALSVDNRYQYFVGNLSKDKAVLEKEFALVEKILTPEWMWVYLELILGDGGSCSICDRYGGSELLEALDRKFWSRWHEVGHLAMSPFGADSEAAGLGEAPRIQLDPESVNTGSDVDDAVCNQEPVLVEDFEKRKQIPKDWYTIEEAAKLMGTTPYLLWTQAEELGISDPYTQVEVDEMYRLRLLGRAGARVRPSEPASSDASEPPDFAESALESPSKALQGVTPQLEDEDSSVDDGISSCASAHGSGFDKWALLKKFAIGVAAVAGAALLAAIANSGSDDEEGEEFNVSMPPNFAGGLPDGTPTFWGPQGGRYYRSSSGRKVYL